MPERISDKLRDPCLPAGRSNLDCRASYKVRWLAMTKGVILNSRLNDTFGQVFQDLRFRIKSGMTKGRGLPPEAGRRNDTKIKYQ